MDLPVDPGWPWATGPIVHPKFVAANLGLALQWYQDHFEDGIQGGGWPTFKFDYVLLSPETRQRLIVFSDALLLWAQSLRGRPEGSSSPEQMMVVREPLHLAIVAGEEEAAMLNLASRNDPSDRRASAVIELHMPLMKRYGARHTADLGAAILGRGTHDVVNVIWSLLPEAQKKMR